MTTPSDSPPTTDSYIADWQAKVAAYDKLRAELFTPNKATLCDALASAGVTHVVVTFDGYGDSGQIESIEARTGDDVVPMPATEIEFARTAWDKPEPDRVRLSIAEAVETMAYDILGFTHAGWENDDGAYGDITFDVADRTVTLGYNERYTTTEYTQHVL